MFAILVIFLILQLSLLVYLLFAVINPVHSVLLLILAFFNAAIFLFLLNIELLSLLFLIIYIGAIAILFIFILIMLDLKEFKFKSPFSLNFYLYISIFFQIELLLSFSNIFKTSEASDFYMFPILEFDDLENSTAVGQVLFNYCNFWVVIAGFILLIAIIGAVALLIKPTFSARKENVAKQLSRSKTVLHFN
jgi:NADH-quinone oxidoreductase subunit J